MAPREIIEGVTDIDEGASTQTSTGWLSPEDLELVRAHVPIVYEADRIRDGRSFSTRRVVAIQHAVRPAIAAPTHHGTKRKETMASTALPAAILLVLYWKRGRAKLEIALARGKQSHDKRASEKARDWQREKGRIMRGR